LSNHLRKAACSAVIFFVGIRQKAASSSRIIEHSPGRSPLSSKSSRSRTRLQAMLHIRIGQGNSMKTIASARGPTRKSIQASLLRPARLHKLATSYSIAFQLKSQGEQRSAIMLRISKISYSYIYYFT
jgi:hypothetical protein